MAMSKRIDPRLRALKPCESQMAKEHPRGVRCEKRESPWRRGHGDSLEGEA
jgi:hypothetical protein